MYWLLVRHLRRSMTVSQLCRTLTFTLKQPPKILHDSSSSWGELLGVVSERSPLYELCGDPTASKYFGIDDGQFGFKSIINLFTEVDDGECEEVDDAVVGTGIAGADGLLGRCLTYKLRLPKPAVDGEPSHPISAISATTITQDDQSSSAVGP